MGDAVDDSAGTARELPSAVRVDDTDRDRVRLLSARFDEPALEAAFVRASLPQVRLVMVVITVMAIIGSMASIYGSWARLGTDRPAFWSASAVRSVHVLMHLIAIVVYVRARKPVYVLGMGAVAVSFGCVAIALRLGVVPAPGAGFEALFNITRDGVVLLLVTSVAILTLIPAWFPVFAAIFTTALVVFMWAIVQSPERPVNPHNLVYAASTAFAFILAMGNGVQRLRRENFAARRRLHEANDKLERLATRDDLTGCANRRHFLALAERELQRARRSESPLSVILLDVDHFKSINDRFGHASGDRILVAIASTVMDRLRASDVLGRLGGEEFAVLLPDTRLQHAVEVAERMRQAIAALDTGGMDTGERLSASFGVTELTDGEAIDNVLARADSELYRAKRDGRDRVASTAKGFAN